MLCITFNLILEIAIPEPTRFFLRVKLNMITVMSIIMHFEQLYNSAVGYTGLESLINMLLANITLRKFLES